MFCAAKIAVYVIAFMGFAGLLVAAIYLVITLGDDVADFSIYFFTLAFMYLFFILALREHLVKCAILMKTISKFVFENPKILLLVFLCLIYCLIIVTVWVLGLYSFCILYAEGNLTYGEFTLSAVFWGFLLVFFNFYNILYTHDYRSSFINSEHYKLIPSTCGNSFSHVLYYYYWHGYATSFHRIYPYHVYPLPITLNYHN